MNNYTLMFWENDMNKYTIIEKNFTNDDIKKYILDDSDERLYTWKFQSGLLDEEEEEEEMSMIKKIVNQDSVKKIISDFNKYCCIGFLELN